MFDSNFIVVREYFIRNNKAICNLFEIFKNKYFCLRGRFSITFRCFQTDTARKNKDSNYSRISMAFLEKSVSKMMPKNGLYLNECKCNKIQVVGAYVTSIDYKLV